MSKSNEVEVPEATEQERTLNYAEFQLFQVESDLSDFYEMNAPKIRYFHLVNLKNKLEEEIKVLKRSGKSNRK